MATCEDCLHCDVCHAVHIGGYVQEGVEACKNFKDQSRFIELPCKVGDVVYSLFHGMMYAEKVIGAHLLIDTDLGGLNANDFGKTVFLSREDAERALKGEINDRQ